MANLDRDYYLDKQGLQTLISELETNIVAEEFSSSATYALGDYCIYDNLLYVCIVPISTAGSWTGNTNWLQVLLADEIASGVSYLRVVNGAVNIVYDDGT